ncbi:MAG: glycosyltransferase [Candidatus Eisenbacteria bacterium]|uniref:Glycosyltransferase n=1 Tax=Eiseniibacteriota bacterium TaxID=2212470 RepID=A0A948RW36_UNCEI|nr:glycosyltransferase [Candidatus Eisenbacteria bacterium]MBU1949298.1 glycosyltransferase [Candidatus Eisenbacteria bacterium]MBU2690072.1 glycosyltransferase [Candidatus Eisenbacteria bacterium]
MSQDGRIGIALLGGGLRLGGAERQIVHLLSGLSKETFRPCLVLKQFDGPLLEEVRRLDIPMLELKFRRIYSPAGYSAVVKLRRFLIKQHVQILQSYLYGSHMMGAAALDLLGGWREMPRPHHVLAIRGHSLPHPAILKLFYRWAGRRASSVVAVSDHLARTAEGWGVPAERLVTIPNGVPRQDADPGGRDRIRGELKLSEDTVLLGMVGNFHPGKGHVDLLQALRKVAAEAPIPWHLMLVGDGRTLSEMERLAAELGIGERITFRGRVEDVGMHLAAMDLFVFPSHSEGMPNALLEAMAAGVPCLASDIPVHREILAGGAAGGLFAPGQVDALAALIRGMLQLSPEQRRESGRRAKRRIEEAYSIPVMIKSYEKLYNNLLEP